jgi:two-component system, OmpR family, sensor histidine kinase MprB
MSFRRRLIAASIASVAVVAILMAAATYVAARSLIYHQLDDGLRNAASVPLPDVVGEAGDQAFGAAGQRVSVPLTTQAPASPAQAPLFFTRVIGPGARLPRGAGALPHELADLRPGETRATTSHVMGTTVRTLASRHPDGRIVIVGTPMDSQLRTLRILLVVLGALVLAAIAVGALGAKLAARTTLAPVRQLTGAAEEIAATRDLAHRVSAADADDELGRMASAFNTMLDALERSQSAQRRLVADASHELRTPLTALRTNMELFLRADVLPPADREALRRDLLGGLRELSVLVDDLVEAAREEAPLEAERDGLDLAEVTDLAVGQARRRHPGVRFIALPLEPTPMVGDAHRLGRALANLLDNAARFSPPGEAVEVALRDGVLAVRDRGPGIDPADRPHVFDRFYRGVASRAQPGNGLGLAIVKAVAEGHGGRVRAEAATGGGARLVVDLSGSPLLRPQPALIESSAQHQDRFTPSA